MKCDKCGTEVSSGGKFCPNCGAEVSDSPEPKKLKYLWIIFSVLAVIIIAVLCTVFPAFLVIAIPLVVLPVSLKIWRPKKNRDTQEVEQQTLTDKETQKLEQYFVSRDEKYISSLGNSYIMNYLAYRSLSKGFAIISNKRVYFRGSCFSGQGRNLVKTNEERTVDIKDITGSGFIYRRYIGILLGLITAFIVLLACTIGSGIAIGHFLQSVEGYQQDVERYQQWAEEERQWAEEHPEQVEEYQQYVEEDQQAAEKYRQYADRNRQWAYLCSAISGVCLPFTIICILIFLNYLKKRKTFFQIQYAGGCIAFDVSYYAKAEIDDFQKQLRRTKDLAEEIASKNTLAESPVPPAAQNSMPDDLRKYAELLKEGLISQEEYDAMKKKILNL